ncbi:MAG: hypothetical protein NWP80_02195, partial [Candidatus Gracilibacteria bacterium]|nr:hypothetical protein [Candidatus Gracilibacteria bacterium]
YYQDKECDRNPNLVRNARLYIHAEIGEDDVFLNGDNQIRFGYNSNNPLRKIQILLGTNIVKEINVENEKIGSYNGTFNIPRGYDGDYVLTIRAIDSIYISKDASYNIKIIQEDTILPIINVINPARGKINIYQDQFFNLRLNIFDNSSLRSVNIYIDDKPYKLGLKDKELTVEINDKQNITVGNHLIKIEAIDFAFNKSEIYVDLEILAR